MANKKYEVLHGIRLPEGELLTDGVVTLDANDPTTKKFLDYEAIRLVPGQGEVQDEPDETPSSTAPVSPAPPAPTVESQALAEIFDADLASTLEAGGYTTLEQVRAASDEELNDVEGVGKKSIEKIRSALA